ncbi:MAG: thioredoxin domain-containing protein [Pseudomonadota bacterium]
MTQSDQPVNRLAGATSPYLQQHAHNPVDWWPWCEEALALARSENKPILLSVGYSACHWCHVMAHESFEDADTAALMNALFVNIKVDREERPDIDKIYQSAHQLLSQRPGGWPLTVFLTPDDHMPFFAGTYFPKESRQGMVAFKDLLRGVHNAWGEQHAAIREQNQQLQSALAQLNPASGDATSLNAEPLQEARNQLAQSFDATHGGFGSAPKFPHCTSIELLLRHWAREPGDSRALHMAAFTLEKMALGGIYDQLGGGFCRYSVDDKWMIPHFEKMLYDNGPLLALYADAWQATGHPLFKKVCEETAAWVMREMQSPEGGYYSTLDADSEGEEGLFYVWDRKGVREILTDDEYRVFEHRYALKNAPNFEGRWHLHADRSFADIAHDLGMDEARVNDLHASGRQRLFEIREKRVHPGRDEKVLASWNALMIKGLARAARVFGRDDWLASVQRALDFVRTTLWRDGRLLATCKDGRAHLAAYLDDYALMLDALLELLQARWDGGDLEFAVELAEVLLDHFEDESQGGFFFTADDHEQLIHRPKPLGDDSVPSGNGIAAYALQRLGFLLAEPRYLEAAERTLNSAWAHMSRIPYAHCTLLMGLDEWLKPPELLIVRGEAEQLEEWRTELTTVYDPTRVVLAIPNDAELPQALAEKRPRPGGVIYPCVGSRCEAPVASPDDLPRLRA